MAYLVTGRAAEATELADAIWRDVDGTLDPYTRILSLFPLALGNIGPAPIGDEGADGDHDVNAAVDRMREEAKRIGSPSLESAAAIFGVITLLSSPEPDADETLTLLDDATEAADLVGDVLWEIQALNLAAQAAGRFGRLDAASRCAAVLERAVDSRFWVVVGQAIPAALVALSGSGREEAVATVVGGIERNFAIAHPLARELIDRVITDARADPVRAEFLAAGDRLERVELVRFMINELSAA